jgi:hypothetical protein
MLGVVWCPSITSNWCKRGYMREVRSEFICIYCLVQVSRHVHFEVIRPLTLFRLEMTEPLLKEDKN